MREILVLCLAAVLLGGCSSVPKQESVNRGELQVSQAVAAYFEDPTVGEIVVGEDSDIRCIRQRRTGTHMVVRICRTKEEWKELQQRTQEVHQQRTSFGPCGDRSPAASNTCSEGRGGF